MGRLPEEPDSTCAVSFALSLPVGPLCLHQVVLFHIWTLYLKKPRAPDPHRSTSRKSEIGSMPPAAAFHAQLASIMEVLANTAVAEICDLVDSSYSVLQLEISRSRKENELLRRKLRLMELRATRASALRAAVTASGSGLLHSHGRVRAQMTGYPPGRGPRRTGPPGGESTTDQERHSNGVFKDRQFKTTVKPLKSLILILYSGYFVYFIILCVLYFFA